MGASSLYMSRKGIRLDCSAEAAARIAARFHSDLGSCVSPNSMDFLSVAG